LEQLTISITSRVRIVEGKQALKRLGDIGWAFRWFNAEIWSSYLPSYFAYNEGVEMIDKITGSEWDGNEQLWRYVCRLYICSFHKLILSIAIHALQPQQSIDPEDQEFISTMPSSNASLDARRLDYLQQRSHWKMVIYLVLIGMIRHWSMLDYLPFLFLMVFSPYKI
jgi:hypothetical protein